MVPFNRQEDKWTCKHAGPSIQPLNHSAHFPPPAPHLVLTTRRGPSLQWCDCWGALLAARSLQTPDIAQIHLLFSACKYLRPPESPWRAGIGWGSRGGGPPRRTGSLVGRCFGAAWQTSQNHPAWHPKQMPVGETQGQKVTHFWKRRNVSICSIIINSNSLRQLEWEHQSVLLPWFGIKHLHPLTASYSPLISHIGLLSPRLSTIISLFTLSFLTLFLSGSSLSVPFSAFFPHTLPL